MLIEQQQFNNPYELLGSLSSFNATDYDLHFVFADKLFFQDEKLNDKIQSIFKNSVVVGCSTSGEIHGPSFNENTFSLTSVKFEKTKIKKATFIIENSEDSFRAGQSLAHNLKNTDLKHVFVLSEGVNVNGSDLLQDLNSVLDRNVNVSGGLAGDNASFNSTFVADETNKFIPNCISAIGFYGQSFQSESSSYGGWDSFGKDLLVTKSVKNIVYEIDHKPALDLYKSYLGDKSKDLPASALYFPLEMRENEFTEPLVRTILAVSESDKSLTFAGNVPENSYVRLMKTNINRVIEGANKSAKLLMDNIEITPELSILISCVGRKLVLNQLTQDEVEAVTENFNSSVVFAGFYSNGEISKMKFVDSCKLHNQTMTITVFSEKNS
jgi:hypothetical protein